MSKTPTTLIIMDGFGVWDERAGNAIAAARTPNLDKIFAENPGCRLSASGLDVGLPEGQMGNSEVGHTNIGAGRVVFQDLPRISRAIEDGSFFENEAYIEAMDDCKERDGALHLMGLLSDGGVHSHIRHLEAICDMAARADVPVRIHCIMDGRDTDPKSGVGFVRALEEHIKDQPRTRIAGLVGRFYAMDRDKRWDRVKAAWDLLAHGQSDEGRVAPDAVTALEVSYAEGITDEFVKPVLCEKGRGPAEEDEPAGMADGDALFLFNFRADRMRELTQAFIEPDFKAFDRGALPELAGVASMTSYEASFGIPVAFPKEAVSMGLGEVVSRAGLRQLRLAETEKYAHVTFFFNGGTETVFSGEDRVLVPSPKVATYDLQPEMSAPEVTEEAVKRIESGNYDVIILNFANCDMVGHTGVFEAAVKAVEAVDAGVGKVVEATSRMGGVSLITADHGNAERMLDADGTTPYTAHTTNLVPFYIVGADVKLRDGRLADIAPTMLDLMGLEKPAEMDGETLIVN